MPTINGIDDHDGAIHGEIGFAIGTAGYREIFGTVVAPLGDRGLLAVSIDTAEFGRAYRVRR